jgi:pimeloyl-ACP methyl ester carboxylesterase
MKSGMHQGMPGLDGVRVYHSMRGADGPRVLLVHAIGFDHRTWNLILPHLEERYRVAVLDLPGHGRSDKPADADYGPWSLGTRVVQLLDELGWNDATLVGNSLGGGVSLAVALQAPERVRALGLLNSVAFRWGLPPVGRLAAVPLVPAIAQYVPVFGVRFGLETCRHRWGSVTPDQCTVSRQYLRTPEGRGAFFRALRHLYGTDLERMAQHYPEIRCPTLVLHGEKDPLIRLSHAERLAKTIPDAEFVRIPRCGHFPQEESAAAVALELRKFLDRTIGKEPST